MEDATCFLWGLSLFPPRDSLCHVSGLFLLSCLFLGLVPVCLAWPLTSMSWIQKRGGHYWSAGPGILPLSPSLPETNGGVKGLHPQPPSPSPPCSVAVRFSATLSVLFIPYTPLSCL